MDTLPSRDFTETVTEFYKISERFEISKRYADAAVGIYHSYVTATSHTHTTKLVKAACYYLAAIIGGESQIESTDVTWHLGISDEDAFINDTLANITTTLGGQLIVMTPAHYLRQYELRGELPDGTWEATRELMHNPRTFDYDPSYLADVIINSRRYKIPFEWPTMIDATAESAGDLTVVSTDNNGTVIGQGSYGKVTSLKGYAYKESDLLAPTLVELAVMRRCKHPNVLSVLGFGYKRDVDEEGEAMITAVLRLPLAVGNLENYLTASNDRKRRWARELFAGLAHLHNKSILHGDIKPANILVMEDDRVVIADFGISEAHVTLGDHTTLRNNAKSTLSYRDINLIPLEGDLSPLGLEVDVWAAGMTLVTMERGSKIEKTMEEVANTVAKEGNAMIFKEFGMSRAEIYRDEDWDVMDKGLIDSYMTEKAWRQYLLDEIVSGNATRGWKDRHYAAVVQSIFVVEARLRPSASEVLSVL